MGDEEEIGVTTNSAKAAAALDATHRGNGGQREVCPTCRQPWLHRSDADHRMFWAVLHLAYENWPTNHEFEPLGRDHLYGWLLTEVGYHHKPVPEIESRNPDFVREIVMAIYPALKSKIHCIRFIPTAKGVRVLIPKSLSYKEAGKRQFEETRSKVYEVIETVLQTDIETLKREAKAAA